MCAQNVTEWWQIVCVKSVKLPLVSGQLINQRNAGRNEWQASMRRVSGNTRNAFQVAYVHSRVCFHLMSFWAWQLQGLVPIESTPCIYRIGRSGWYGIWSQSQSNHVYSFANGPGVGKGWIVVNQNRLADTHLALDTNWIGSLYSSLDDCISVWPGL